MNSNQYYSSEDVFGRSLDKNNAALRLEVVTGPSTPNTGEITTGNDALSSSFNHDEQSIRVVLSGNVKGTSGTSGVDGNFYGSSGTSGISGTSGYSPYGVTRPFVGVSKDTQSLGGEVNGYKLSTYDYTGEITTIDTIVISYYDKENILVRNWLLSFKGYIKIEQSEISTLFAIYRILSVIDQPILDQIRFEVVCLNGSAGDNINDFTNMRLSSYGADGTSGTSGKDGTFGTSGSSGTSPDPIIDQDFFYDTDTDTLYVQNINTSGLTLTGETAGYVKTDDNGTVYVSVPTIDESFYYDNDANTLYVDNININGLYQSSTAYTYDIYLSSDINIAYIDCTGGNKYVYLPASEGSGKTITVKKIDDTFNYLTVRPLLSDLLDSINNFKYITIPNQAIQIHDAELGKWYILNDYNNNVNNLLKITTTNNFGTSIVYSTYIYDYADDGSCLLMTAVGKKGIINIIKNIAPYDLVITMRNGQTLDTDTSKTLAQFESITVQSDDSNWWII